MEKQLLEQILNNQKILLGQNQLIMEQVKRLELDIYIIKQLLKDIGTEKKNLSKHGGYTGK